MIIEPEPIPYKASALPIVLFITLPLHIFFFSRVFLNYSLLICYPDTFSPLLSHPEAASVGNTCLGDLGKVR